ncbi:MAG: transposase [Acidobacteriota bacterium]
MEFIRRFLQHVLPRGCAKVRYYGIWSGSCRKRLDQARALLSVPPSDAPVDSVSDASRSDRPVRSPARCPYCKIGLLIGIELIHPLRRTPP